MKLLGLLVAAFCLIGGLALILYGNTDVVEADTPEELLAKLRKKGL